MYSPYSGSSLVSGDVFPNGLSGDNVTITISNTSVGQITGISYPSWAQLNVNTALPASSVTFSEADTGNQVQAGATNVPLATLTISGLVTNGTATLTVSVNACDNDSGGAINPSVSSGTITVSPGSGSVPAGGIGGAAAPYGIPTNPFTTASNSGVHMSAVALNSTTKSENLTAHIDNPTTDPVAWFVIGNASGKYSYFTAAYPPNSTGYVVIPLPLSSPLNQNSLYYVRAASINGRSSEELSFSTASPQTLPTTNFSQYFYNIQYSNHTPLNILAAIPLPIVDLFGGGYYNSTQASNRPFGWMIFWTIIFGMIAIILAVRQDNMIMVFEMVSLGAGIILTIMDPEFFWMIIAFLIVTAATTLYRIYRRE